jgi:hypothetical protein
MAGNSGHISAHNNLSTIISGNNLQFSVLDTAYSGGADPTGSSDSAPAFNAALNAAAAAGSGNVVLVPQGNYKINSPVVVPPYTGLTGSPASGTIGTITSGSVLLPSATFSAGSWPYAAAILIVSQDVGSYSTVSEEQHISWLMIQGSNLSATGQCDGISAWSGTNGTGRITLQNILIYGMTGWGYSVPNNAGGNTRAFNVNIRSCGTNHSNSAGGFQIHNSDSEWCFCAAYSNYGYQFSILDSWDSVFSQCHGEHSGSTDCWYFHGTYNNGTVDAGCISFDGCSVDASEGHGVHITGSGSALPPVNWTGGFIRRPGTSGGKSGICVDGYDGPVDFTGTQVYPGEPDGGGSNYPQYALSVINGGGNTTNVTVTGGVLIGASAPFNLDGTANSVTISGSTTFGSGQGNYPGTTYYTPGVALQANSSTELIPIDGILPMQPLGTLATSHDRSAVTSSLTPASGQDYYHVVRLVAGVPVTNIITWVTGTGKSGGSHGWVNIISGATGKVVATSADQTDAATTWHPANAGQAIALTSPYTPPDTGIYWVGFCIVATTMPTLGGSGTLVGQLAVQVPAYCGTGAGSRTTPLAVGTSVTIGGIGADDYYMFCN